MAQFYKNFEGDALGAQPSDIARTWDTSRAITIVDLPPKRLAVPQDLFARRAAYLTVVPQNADLECLASMSVSATASSIGLMSLRANVGSSASRTGYVLFVRFDTGVIEIRRAIDGARVLQLATGRADDNAYTLKCIASTTAGEVLTLTAVITMQEGA